MKELIQQVYGKLMQYKRNKGCNGALNRNRNELNRWTNDILNRWSSEK